jgi:hypothetical protein
VKAVFSNKEFVEKLLGASDSEALKMLKEKDLVYNLEEFHAIRTTITSYQNGELSADLLESVAGGQGTDMEVNAVPIPIAAIVVKAAPNLVGTAGGIVIAIINSDAPVET